MRLFLTTIILTMLAQPVWAQKVYYCETTAFAQVTQENEIADVRPYRFKMAVSENVVKISGADFFSIYFDEVKVTGQGSFFAIAYTRSFPLTLASFRPPNLQVTDLADTQLSAFNAHCEDF